MNRKYLLKFQKLFELLQKKGIDFALYEDIGIYMWGVRKKIRYVDIIIDRSEENIKKLLNQMRIMGMKVKGGLNYKVLASCLEKGSDYSKKNSFIIFYHKRIFPWRIRISLEYDLKDFNTVEKRLGDNKVKVIEIDRIFEIKRKRINLKEIQDIYFIRKLFPEAIEKF
jgi:hypothetical protein